ncbi:cytochrome P450 [Streptomyces cacaoi]|uniref:cytochrome P450 n=1 Tax=Streptomyces cacaoi TaxID=1898 RepID=UPI003747E571
MSVRTVERRTPGVARCLGAADTARVLTRVLLPTVLEGPVLRRRWAMALAERFQWEATAVATVRGLFARRGSGPLLMRAFGRRLALVGDPDHVRRVLEGTPTPFSPASAEKRAALDQFQPHGSLISQGRVRQERRRANEAALEPGRPLHRAAGRIAAVAGAEAAAVTRQAAGRGVLDWDTFARGWWRAVRSIVFGEAAREEAEPVRTLERLRAAGNWAYLSPRRRALRDRFVAGLREAVGRAEPGSLAAALPDPAGTEPDVDPYGQVAHWLFAYDAAGMATLRTLALLATHPDAAARAHREAAQAVRGAGAGPAAQSAGQPAELPFLRACVLESVRLWPTTPLLLRESSDETDLDGAHLPEGTALVLFTPYLHRSAPAGAYAHRFAPDIWLDGTAAANPALVPFSSGPGRCPGRDVVLSTASNWLAGALTAGPAHGLVSRTRPVPGAPLPATLDHFGLRFTVRG